MFAHVGHIVKGNALAYNYSLHGCGTEVIVYCIVHPIMVLLCRY